MSARHPAVSAYILATLGDPPPKGSQSALAAAVGTSNSTVSRWLSLQSSPDPALWPAIEDHLQLARGKLAAATQREQRMGTNVTVEPPDGVVSHAFAGSRDEFREAIAHLTEAVLIDLVDMPGHYRIRWDISDDGGVEAVVIEDRLTPIDAEVGRLRREVDALKQAVEALLVGEHSDVDELLGSIRAAGASTEAPRSAG